MTVLDAYPIVAYLLSETAAPDVESLLRRQDCVTTAHALAEVSDRLVRLGRLDARRTALYVRRLGLRTVVALDAPLAVRAGLLRAQHYHRTRRSVSMADCVAAATAHRLAEPLATSDPHLLDLCHDEQIDIIVLPGSDGSVWTAP